MTIRSETTEHATAPSNHEISTIEVNKHVEKNRVRVKKGRRCVDGRYIQELGQEGTIARPGGDIGYALVLHGLSQEKGWDLTAQECVDIVFDAVVVGLNGKFYMHTDEHVEHENREKGMDEQTLGCGHINNASIPFNADLYGVNPILVQEMINYSRKLANEKKDKVVNVLLPGSHLESAVLKVTGKAYTVDPSDKETGTMYFVYDQVRDDEFIQTLIDKIIKRQISKKIHGLNFKDFKRVSDRQLNATLSLLAREKPVFEVDADAKPYLVRYVGVVK